MIVLHIIFRGLPTADTAPKKSSTDLSAFYEISAPAQAVLAARGVHGNVPVTRLCETAYSDTDKANGCSKLNGWLADDELRLAPIINDPNAPSYGESMDWRALMGSLRNERDMLMTFPSNAATPHLVWMRSPLQFAAGAEDVDASLPLGWLLGESGAVILDRVDGHVASLADELGCYVAPSGDASVLAPTLIAKFRN